MLTLLNLNVAGYIDPSVMTYAIQAIAGVIIAVGAFLGIYLRKAKKKLNNKLGIDENRNKEVETDDIVCLLYTSPSPRDSTSSRMPSSA